MTPDSDPPPFMQSAALREELRVLRATYFTDPSRRISLKKGETLMRQHEMNTRLYLILHGTVSSWTLDANGREYELFQATTNMFVGVYSLFSRTYESLTHIIAEEDTDLAYIESHELETEDLMGFPLYERFLPVIVAGLVHRHQRTKELVMERERTPEKMIENAKMVSLGQMAAGIAHELNNAVAVLERNTAWLSDSLKKYLSDTHSTYLSFFQNGLDDGRRLSSREIRQQSRDLRTQYGYSRDLARKMVEAGFPDDAAQKQSPDQKRAIVEGHLYWEFGAAFHDMRLAAQHATHVVKSMKTLGAPHGLRRPDVDVNETIHEAQALLRRLLRRVNVDLSLAALPMITASKGELVQVWTNLIKNACESMLQAETPTPQLHIRSTSDGVHVRVQVEDNGPGIPPENLTLIFQPDVTTKVGGLSFGLGLGLTIVERIVNSYGGTIAVESVPGKTVFSVDLPIL